MLNWLAHYFLPTKEVLQLREGSLLAELKSLEYMRQQQGGVLWSEEWRRFHSINAELGEVRARLAQLAAEPAKTGGA